MTNGTSWRMRGDVMEACNCNITCPCNFGGPITQLPCEAIVGFRIQEGNYGATRLDNLNVVLYVQMPGPNAFDGNWTMGAFLDQRANEEQMQALGTILTGQAGGWPDALGGLIGTMLEPKQVTITFDVADGDGQINIPGLLEVASEHIANPMPGAPPLEATATGLTVPFYNDGPAGIRRSSVFSLTDPGLSFQHPNGSSLIGRFDYTGP